MLPTASTVATAAPTVTALGRSPCSRGSSCARTAAFLASERDGRGAGAGRGAVAGSARRFLLRLPTHRLPHERPAQRRGGGARVGGVADRADDRYPLGTGLCHGGCAFS